MICYNKDGNPIKISDGIVRKTLAHGKNTLLVEFTIKSGAELPIHVHPYEQTGYLVKGKMTFWIEDESFVVCSGDSWCIPSGKPHRALCHEDAIAIDVFSPVRKDYLP